MAQDKLTIKLSYIKIFDKKILKIECGVSL